MKKPNFKKFEKKLVKTIKKLKKRLRKLKPKRKKRKVKTEKQIRARRKELLKIQEEIRLDPSCTKNDVAEIQSVIVEFNWILGEEKPIKKIPKEIYEKKIAELEEENKRLNVQAKLLSRD